MKKLYSPKGTVTEGLYTSGDKFVVKGLDTYYVGYYNIQSNGSCYTGFSYKLDSNPLIEKKSSFINNKTIFMYDEVKEYSFKSNFNVAFTEFMPSLDDYKTGYVTRYFCKKHKFEYIVEINKKQYDKLLSRNYSNSYVYSYIKVNWKLTGVMFDVMEGNVRVVNGVYDSNKRSVVNADKTLFGLKQYINSYTEKTIFSDYYKKLVANDNTNS